MIALRLGDKLLGFHIVFYSLFIVFGELFDVHTVLRVCSFSFHFVLVFFKLADFFHFLRVFHVYVELSGILLFTKVGSDW